MRLKLIACEVFTREVCLAAAKTPHIVDIEFTSKGAHEESEYLKEIIQKKIDDAEKSEVDYDAILLGFGLCGNSILGIKSEEIPLIVPRAHDCCTIFLGEKEKFEEYFGNRLSAEWTSPGYMERGDNVLREEELEDTLGRSKSYKELVEQYGEDNAKYVWEKLHPENNAADNLIYIEIEEFADLGYLEEAQKEAEKEGKELEKIPGNMRLIKKMIFGEWEEQDFLTVKPGEEIKAKYDFEQVISSSS